MTDFVFELLSEEIPARMQAAAAEQLRVRFGDGIKGRVPFDGIDVHATPRRLALYARGMGATGNVVSEERRGPRADAPAAAIEGFLRSTGLPREQLEERATPKGTFLYAVVEQGGRPTTEVLADLIPQIIRYFDWPKSMRWGAASARRDSLRWVRPLTGIVALFGDAVVPFEAAGVASGRTTVGHRFMSSGEIEIARAGSYIDRMRAAHVMLDPDERAAVIVAGATAAATAAGLSLIPDPGLVAENAGLTEWPVPLLGRFDPAFLDVPREIIQLTMRTNQKYFACVDAEGSLAPAFVCVANLEAADGGAGIVAGNAKVLAARLADAKFFWDADRAVTLESRLPKLKDIVFHEHLGSVGKYVDEMSLFARWLAASGTVQGAGHQLTYDAARLCKADLVSATVGEFPEVQGIAGGQLAAAEGLDPHIAAAIRDHYKPVGPSDVVPTAPVTVALALADKFYTLGRFFAIGQNPTGSKDPFALRRAGLGIIAILLTNNIRVTVSDLVKGVIGSPLADSELPRIRAFLADRLKVQQREAGVRPDIIDAVFALGGEDDLVRLLARVHALQAFLRTPDGANLLAGYKRAANILRIEEAKGDGFTGDDDAARLVEPAEIALAATLDTALPDAQAAVVAEDFAGAMTALSRLRPAVDAFFETVIVNAPDAALRRNRLNLLARFRAAVHSVADFSKIEG